MKEIGSYRGYKIYWSDPRSDGGNGTGEVMVGSDSVGRANTQSEAQKQAERHIDTYLGKMGP